MGSGASKQAAAASLALRFKTKSRQGSPEAIKARLEAIAGDTANPKRYIDPDAIWAVLKLGWVRLVRMTYLIELSKKGGVLADLGRSAQPQR